MKLNKEERIQKLKEIAKPLDPNAIWKQRAEWATENKEWIEDAFIIAFKVLDSLKSQGLTQKDLAERLNITPQAVTKIVKGRQNLTLGTIRKLEAALGISIISIKKPEQQSTTVRVKMVPVQIHYSTTSYIRNVDIKSLSSKVKKPKKNITLLTACA